VVPLARKCLLPVQRGELGGEHCQRENLNIRECFSYGREGGKGKKKRDRILIEKEVIHQ